MLVLQAVTDYDPVLVGAISFLVGAVSLVARTAYQSMREERDFLRNEVLAALTAIIQRAAEVTRQRDEMVADLKAEYSNLRRLIMRKAGGQQR